MADTTEFLGAPGRDPVELVAYDPRWPAVFAVWHRRLAAALEDAAAAIEHIGSTSVPGRPAKPVIDIDVAVPDLADEASYRPAAEGLGLILAIREPGQRFFRPVVARDAPREVHVHVCQAGSRWLRDDLTFRDYLRAYHERHAAYDQLNAPRGQAPTRQGSLCGGQDRLRRRDPRARPARRPRLDPRFGSALAGRPAADAGGQPDGHRQRGVLTTRATSSAVGRVPVVPISDAGYTNPEQSEVTSLIRSPGDQEHRVQPVLGSPTPAPVSARCIAS